MRGFHPRDIIVKAVTTLGSDDYIQVTVKRPDGGYDEGFITKSDLATTIGSSNSVGGLTWEKGAGPPPTDGTVLKQGYKNTTTGVKYINLAWPDTANPEWDPL